MLLYNDDLRKAHMLKEWFYDICQNPKYSIQRAQFYEWIKMQKDVVLKRTSYGIRNFERFRTRILHSSN